MLSDGDSGNRKQTSVLLQANWQTTAKTKFGLNWGASKLRDDAAQTCTQCGCCARGAGLWI